MKPRSPSEASRAVSDAIDTVIEENLWDAAKAAVDGRPKEYLADIISGKAEGPYKPTSGWRTRGR